MKNKVKLFIDKKDLEVLCTKDNIINITGMIGSGKSTLANKYRNDKKYVVISLDCLYRGQDKDNLNKETEKILKILTQKFPAQNSEEYFVKYYHEILNYINTCDKSVIYVLEGQHIYRYLKLKEIKGKLIIKRTCIFKCYKRSIIRHIKKLKIELNKNLISTKQYYHSVWYWVKRRTNQLKYYKKLNQFLNQIDSR